MKYSNEWAQALHTLKYYLYRTCSFENVLFNKSLWLIGDNTGHQFDPNLLIDTSYPLAHNSYQTRARKWFLESFWTASHVTGREKRHSSHPESWTNYSLFHSRPCLAIISLGFEHAIFQPSEPFFFLVLLFSFFHNRQTLPHIHMFLLVL